MKTMNVTRCLGVAALVLSSLTVASNAAAAPVDNPGTFELTPAPNAPVLEFASGQHSIINWSGTAGLKIPLDSAGTIDTQNASAWYETEDIGTVGPYPHVQARFVVLADGISGTINAAKGHADIQLTAYVEFTGPGHCLTKPFTVPLKTYDVYPRAGEGYITELSMTGEVVIPNVVEDSQCSATVASYLDGYLRLGYDAQPATVWIYRAKFDHDVKGG